ncbi:hypothetical protein [Actinomadura keratinilytica]|jgi:hypothetical protein|uniref:DUF1440 domain-containing protein n=1 Tax=Actinomadura keratinilytica TaxID=547461 RepID=A0ABP7Z3X2_9ACTN
MGTIAKGLIAGAVGTGALNVATYLDMAARARPASGTPEETVRRLARGAGVGLGEGERAGNREAGLGPLLGYATGLGAAVAYGPLARRLPWPVGAVVLTALAMAGSIGPMAALGVTDPRRWSAADWASDVVPHLAYGVAAAAAFRSLG